MDFSGYDVLHAHGDDYWMWRRRVPRHVRTLHGSCFEEARTVRGVEEKVRMVALGFSEVLASLAADTTVVVSPSTRRWVPWVRDVVPNGVDTDRFRPSDTSPADRPTVLFVGTWYGRKRGAALAEAFADDVLPAIPDAELWMVTQDAPPITRARHAVLGRLCDEALGDPTGGRGCSASPRLRGVRHPVRRGDGQRDAGGGDPQRRRALPDDGPGRGNRRSARPRPDAPQVALPSGCSQPTGDSRVAAFGGVRAARRRGSV